MNDLGNLTQTIFDDATYPHSYFGSALDLVGQPSGGQYRIIYIPYFSNVEGYSVQIAVGAVGNDKLCWRKSHGKTWQPWNTAVTATPPEARPLALEAGLHASTDVPVEYSKDQTGRVYVEGTVECDAGQSLLPSQHIFTLPVGYRSSKKRIRNGTVDNQSELRPCQIYLEPNTGNGFLWQAGGGLPGANLLVISFSFQADMGP